VKNAHGGRGVPRSRLSWPLSRITARLVTRPAKVLAMTAIPSMPGAKKLV
jgi:hypothetical protein